MALQLEVPKHVADLKLNPISLLAFFLTFAIVCAIWVVHYRMFRLVFQPNALDVALNFAFLAATAILPYSMQVYIHFAPNAARSETILPYALYIASFFGTSLPMALLFYRGLLRRDPALTDAERLDAFRGCIRNSAITCTTILCALILMFIKPSWLAMYPFVLMAIVLSVVRRRIKTVPARFRPIESIP